MASALKLKTDDNPKKRFKNKAEAARQLHGPSSSDQVVSAIRKGILAGRYAPGQRLIEADLMRGLQVSRPPIREALKRLDAEGIVVINPHRGAYVRALERIEALDLLAVLEVTIGLAARLAASHIGEPGNKEIFTASYERLKTNAGHVERAEFYATIFQIAENRELARINPVIQAHILRTQVHAYLSEQDRALQFEDYHPLARAILASEPALSERIVRRHIRRSRRQIEQLDEEAFSVSL